MILEGNMIKHESDTPRQTKLKCSFQRVLPLYFHLDCVDDTTGHDGEFPSDRAHSQFELRHVWCSRQHVGETVRACCVHQGEKSPLRG